MTEVPSQKRFVGFAPGNAVAVVGDRTVALLETDPRSRLVADLAEAIKADADLDLLTAILVGAGLRSLPPLALVQIEGGVARAILRGDIVVVARTATGGTGEEIRAGDVITWVERVVEDVLQVEIRRGGETAEISVFEISAGIVPAALLDVSVAEANQVVRSEPLVISDGEQVPPPEEQGFAGEEAGIIVTPADSEQSSLSVEGEAADPGGTDLDDSEGVAPSTVNETFRFREEVARVQADADGIDNGAPDDVDDGSGDAAGSASEHATLDGAADAPSSDDGARTLDPVSGATVGDASDSDDAYDHLFGATEFRPLSLAGIDEDVSGDSQGAAGLISSIPGAAPTASTGGISQGSAGLQADTPSADADPETDAGDHDGMTISVAQFRAAQGLGGSSPEPSAGQAAGDAMVETVHAVSCPAGHLNPPAAVSCRVCGVEIAAQDHVSVPRPVLGVLRFSNGDELPLVRSMLMGRSPKASGTSRGSQLPELITLESPSKELSGTHLELRIEGWQVLAIDRRSTNGTTVALPGRDPQRLHPGNAIPIVPGTVIDMAEEVQFTFEVTE